MTMDPSGQSPGRIRNPTTKFYPVGGAPAKGRKRTPSGHAAGTTKSVRTPAHGRVPKGRSAPKAAGTGGHSSAHTAQRKSGFVGKGRVPRGSILGEPTDSTHTLSFDPSTTRSTLENTTAVGSHDGMAFHELTGSEPGYTGQNAHSLGHHPLADGYTHLPAAQAHSLIRRAALLGYDPVANLAVIRLGNTPDSPLTTIPAQPQFSPSQMAAATEVYITHNGQVDFTDASISGIT